VAYLREACQLARQTAVIGIGAARHAVACFTTFPACARPVGVCDEIPGAVTFEDLSDDGTGVQVEDLHVY